MKRFLTKTTLFSALLCAALVFAAGCGDSGSADNGGDSPGDNASAALPDGLILTSAPEGAQSIIELKANASEGDEVVARVTIGGHKDPIVIGRASAMIVDAGLFNRCTTDEDPCPFPWDYCCAEPGELAANKATLQIIDADGRVLATDLAKQFPPLTTLVVRGVVGPRANDEVLTINATGIYIEQGAQQ